MAVTAEHHRTTPRPSGSCYQWNDRVIAILHLVDFQGFNLQKIGKVCSLPFNSQDLISNSPYCLPYSSSDVSLENLVWDQLIIPLLIFFFILITCLLDIVLILEGEILSCSLMGVKGLSQVAHLARGYPGFCSMKQLEVFLSLPPWMECSSITGYGQAFCQLSLTVSLYPLTPLDGERHGESEVSCPITQHSDLATS